MIKDTNIRDKVTITREQSKELTEIGKKYKMSKSAVIGFAIRALLSYKVGDALGEWLINKLDEERGNND